MTMLKKILIIGTLCVIPFSITHATNPYAATIIRNNFSIYINPGVSYINIKSSSPLSNEPGSTASLLAYQGLNPRLAVGVDMFTSPIGGFYIALEGIAEPVRALTINNRPLPEDPIYGPQSGGSMRPYWLFAINVLPGIQLDYWVRAYLRFGAAKANFRTLSETRNGYQIGAGFEWVINRTWGFRGDYTHTAFTNIPNAGSPRMDELTASAVIHFFY